MKFKKFIFGIVMALIGITFALALAEFGMRLFAPEWLSLRMKELNLATNAEDFGSDVGWSVESVDGKFVRFTPDTTWKLRYYEYNHDVNIDQQGGRKHRGDSSLPLVPFLGDSFTFGVGVKDDETFPAILNSGRPFYHLVLGVPGTALPQQVQIIRFRHSEIGSPRAYVFSIFTGNDFMDVAKYYASTGGGQKGSKKGSSFFESLFQHRTFGKSYLLQYLRATVFRPPQSDASDKSVLTECTVRNPKRVKNKNPLLSVMSGNSKCIDQTRQSWQQAIDELKAASNDLHFKAIFLLIPDKPQVYLSALEERTGKFGLAPESFDPARPNTLLTEMLKGAGFEVVDPSDCLREKTGVYYKVDDHFTPEGHRVFAECVKPRLIPWLDRNF